MTDNVDDFPSDKLVVRFSELFIGNTRSCGQFDPSTEKMFTKPGGLELRDFDAHFAGVMGAGAVPINDEDMCAWGAIDIDNHGSNEDIPIDKIDEIIREEALPLVPCRSKSGGVHAYLFLEKPQPAATIRAVLSKWSTVLGYAGHEIFPKQARLVKTASGEKQLGNWINLPYFNNTATNRYAVHNGRRLTLTQFVDLAEKKLTSEADLRIHTLAEYRDAPPCVQKMVQAGVTQGHRNEALYNTVIYLKKAFPESYEQKAFEVNATMFKKPLPKAEAARTITSAARPDYSYRCGEEPCKSLCDRQTCLKRKHGITLSEAGRLDSMEVIPTFTDLTKYLTEPVRWEIQMDGTLLTNISTAQLLSWPIMRELIAERLTRIVPMIKPIEWERCLQPLMQNARIIETPDEASTSGAMRDKLREFASKTNLLSKGEDKDDRKALLRGMPVVQLIDGIRCIVFRAQDFVNYLKRTKSEEMKGTNLWFAVKSMGVGNTRIRAGGSIVSVWYLPIDQIIKFDLEPAKFDIEI